MWTVHPRLRRGDMSRHDPHSRRDLLANLAVAATVIPGFGLVTRYVFRFLVPRSGHGAEEVLIGKLSGMPVGASRLINGVHGNDLIAVRLADNQVKIFSSICTHLGCRVHWDPTAGNFLCPCHMGRFDANGEVIGGPPPEPLPAFPVNVQDDHLFVRVPVEET